MTSNPISVRVDVKCAKCKKEATLTEDEAEYSSAWVKVTLTAVHAREQSIGGRPKHTCLCQSCAMATFPDLYPMEVVGG